LALPQLVQVEHVLREIASPIAADNVDEPELLKLPECVNHRALANAGVRNDACHPREALPAIVIAAAGQVLQDVELGAVAQR